MTRERIGRRTEELSLVTKKRRQALGPTSTQNFEGGLAEEGDLDRLEGATENCCMPVVQHYIVYVSSSHINALTTG